jgi:predicted nucleic acid-binding protein
MNQSKKLRLFLDSNVLTGGLMARWGLDKAILSLCAAHACQMVLAEIVREEVERNLLKKALDSNLDREAADQLLSDYDHLISLAKPEVVPLPDKVVVLGSRNLIRHAADVPVLVSAINAKPDWLITHNTNHFTAEVAQRTGLRIATPFGFFREIVQSFSQGRESE